jgi:hypothetical protein
MKNYALAGRCGIYCGSCALYRAYTDGGEYLQQMAKEWQMPLRKIRCNGCHALTPNCAGNECQIVRCLDSKGFEYCFECQEYQHKSCKKFAENAEKCLKYNVDLRANLERIRAGEVEAWLKECEEQFKCGKCGKPLPALGWEETRCYHCGADVTKLLP